jgi:hypothetical protein
MALRGWTARKKAKKGKSKDEEAACIFDKPGAFQRGQLENYLALLVPFKLEDASAHGLLQISPYGLQPDVREDITKRITMPDVFLQHNLVPLLIPMCSGQSSELLTRWSCHTLYLYLLSFARPVPTEQAEELDVQKAQEKFKSVLQEFRVKCQLGDVNENLGGVKVLMDVLWKLFTRRKSYVPPEKHLCIFNEEENENMRVDNYYYVPFWNG